MALVGDTIRLYVEFRNFENEKIDPSNINLQILDEQGQEIENITIDSSNKLDVGKYFYDYVVPEGTGDLYFVFSGICNNKPIKAKGKFSREV
ncbi:hypothetical protein [Thermosediminibacter oceani]|uniref:Uncharacterized protein n=1 Tax=Thermosediminibacter oceani (strain ATCC BAA-1034 / DSM 16646 / JW/IW-1228P) TaxID=555079 RepID=D9S2X5_THEOJ|nr:hypothetical protein [Thermosediminibacter oceani]ADL07752.1 conserved hypothetical protein [Thermosediminibacter oceani DSM 16646]